MEYKNLLKKFNSNAGISKAKLSTIGLPSEVPEEYLNFLEFCNGGEGFIGEEYLILYKAEEIQQKNLDYAVSDIIPGICLFGSNGASEALAFDMRDGNLKYIIIPFLFEQDAIIQLGHTFEEFLYRITDKGFFV